MYEQRKRKKTIAAKTPQKRPKFDTNAPATDTKKSKSKKKNKARIVKTALPSNTKQAISEAPTKSTQLQATQQQQPKKKNKKKKKGLAVVVAAEEHKQSVPDTNATQGNKKKKQKKNIQKTKSAPKVSSSTKNPLPHAPPSFANLTPLQRKMQAKLQGARFRFLNEKLYTCTGTEALEFMKDDASNFYAYHEGYRSQVEKWPQNPLDIFIRYLKSKPKLVVGDFGCGEARLAKSVPNKVHSFDLVAANEHIVACDIANVPLPDTCLDVAVFCLSLMGVNFIDFLAEAFRTLKLNGELKIAEVRSRFPKNSYTSFIADVVKMGFKLTRQDEKNKMFVLFDFVKVGKGKRAAGVASSSGSLQACIYKRR